MGLASEPGDVALIRQDPMVARRQCGGSFVKTPGLLPGEGSLSFGRVAEMRLDVQVAKWGSASSVNQGCPSPAPRPI